MAQDQTALGQDGGDRWADSVTVSSPDRSVVIHATWQGDLEVELSPYCPRRHTEASLARQVTAAARFAMAAVQKAFDERQSGLATEERRIVEDRPRW